MHLDVALLPPRLLRRLPIGGSAEHHVNVLLSLSLIVVVFLNGWALGLLESLPHGCLSEYMLGIPCPGCDMTGSLSLIAQGSVASSLRLQPCGLLLVAVVAVQSATRFTLLLRWVREDAAIGFIKLLGNAFVVVLLAWWFHRLVGI
jgi:hypothetical protein